MSCRQIDFLIAATMELSIQKKLVQCTGAEAGVVELADTSDLGSGAERLGGSNPLARNCKNKPQKNLFSRAFLVPVPLYCYCGLA